MTAGWVVLAILGPVVAFWVVTESLAWLLRLMHRRRMRARLAALDQTIEGLVLEPHLWRQFEGERYVHADLARLRHLRSQIAGELCRGAG